MDDFELQVKVTSSGESVYDTHYVNYDDGSQSIQLIDSEVSFNVDWSLTQNYPNPFNPSTMIKFAIKETCPVSLIVYNVLGQEIAQLVKGIYEKGSYQVIFDTTLNGRSLPSGIYYYRIEAGDYIETRKMLLVK